MKQFKLFLIISLFFCLVGLTACGGGGGGGASDNTGTSSSSTSTSSSNSTSTSSSTSSTSSSSTSSSSGSSSSSSGSTSLPPVLIGPGFQIFETNATIEAVAFSNSGGGELTTCSADTLPQGLAVAVSEDGTICVLSGTPTETQLEITHTITAVNAVGQSTATIRIVVEIAPPDLQNPGNLAFVRGQLVDVQLENSGGGEISDCTSNLPESLNVQPTENGQSCEIIGELVLAQTATDFTVTASNASGDSSALFSIQIDEPTPYITTWLTDNPGASNDDQITIHLASGVAYNFSIDWGDGNSDSNVTEAITHTYAEPGTYTVTITGQYPQPFFPSNDSDSAKLLTVEQWGNRPWLSMQRAFFSANNLLINDLQNPDLSRVTNLEGMFFNASNFNSDISAWDVSNVTTMLRMFRSANNFNQDISGWNVSNVRNMSEMFKGANDFNQDLSGWNVSNLQTMEEMFMEASVFNADISTWDVSNVTNLRKTFENARAFNQDISNWNVAKVTNMRTTFNSASSFDQNLAGWEVSQVTDFTSMFINSGLSIENYDALLIGWAAQGVREDRNFSANPTQYSEAAQAARDVLTEGFGWTITDGGLISLPALESASATFYRNNAVLFTIENTGGNPDECVSADLPDGLSVQVSASGDTCEIVGVSAALQAATQTNVTASNALGSVDSTIDITILEETAFITTWLTDNPGISDDNQITLLPSPEFTYNYTVDWGDGNVDENVSAAITHTYAVPGEYQISITGAYPQPWFIENSDNNFTDSSKLLSVDQWGARTWLSMKQAFYNARNLTINDTENPDLRQVKSMKNMFRNADNLSGNMANWDVSNVTDMSDMFGGGDFFNTDIGAWDVSNVTTMSGMLAVGSFNQDISAWDVGNVSDMSSMFRANNNFNQEIGAWNVSQVENMSEMFSSAQFNADISGWNVSSVVNFSEMFAYNSVFNQDITAWDVSSATDMSQMFREAVSFNQDISLWDVSNVTNMQSMLRDTISFNQNIANWNIVNVTDMSFMLRGSVLSTENYDALLIAWSAKEPQTDVTLNAESIQFSEAAQAARDSLVIDFGWIIVDGGLVE